MAGPLSGVRVLDLSRILAGPWATQIFADYGADVVKVERPGAGDDTRAFGPPWIRDRETGEIVDAAYYAACNRGKRSVTVDIGKPEGQAIVRRLAASVDVIVENYKVGALGKLGLDYEAVRAVNPRIVYCSITGFGQSGPYRNRPGYDFLIQAMGGLMSVTGERDGLPGAGPQRVGVALADIVCGLYATSAITAALYRRERTGEGEYIDLALLDAQVAVLANQGMNYLIGGERPVRMGNGHPNIVPYQPFATADGDILLAVGNDKYGGFARRRAVPSSASDLRYATIGARNTNRDELIPRIAAVIRQRQSSEWITLLEQANVPCGPINAIDQVFDDPQVQARGHAPGLAASARPERCPRSPIRSASPARPSPTNTPRRRSASIPMKCSSRFWGSTLKRAQRCGPGASSEPWSGSRSQSEIWDERETWSRDRLHDYQLRALRRQSGGLRPTAHFMPRALRLPGSCPADLQSLEDLRRLPLTTKQDYLDALGNPPPWGSALGCLPRELARVHFSSGTTALPAPNAWTGRDLDRWADLYARYLYAQGLRPGDVFQVLFSYPWFVGGLGATAGAQRVGATVIPGGSGDTERQIQTMLRFGTVCFVSTPSFAAYLAEVASGLGIDPREIGIRAMGLGGEPGASIDSTRRARADVGGARLRLLRMP